MENRFKYNSERKEKEYFIDPLGNIIKCNGDLNGTIYSFHNEIALQLYPDTKEYPKDVLMKLGYIMVGSVVYNIPIIHTKPTQAQINILYDLNLYNKLCFLYKGYYENYEKYNILCD
jgi:hypothetical protein